MSLRKILKDAVPLTTHAIKFLNILLHTVFRFDVTVISASGLCIYVIIVVNASVTLVDIPWKLFQGVRASGPTAKRLLMRY